MLFKPGVSSNKIIDFLMWFLMQSVQYDTFFLIP